MQILLKSYKDVEKLHLKMLPGYYRRIRLSPLFWEMRTVDELACISNHVQTGYVYLDFKYCEYKLAKAEYSSKNYRISGIQRL